MWTSHKVKSLCRCVHVCLVHCACPLRFATNEQGLLLASDVAARGLDIHKVQHVIHYHVPVNSDVRGRKGGRGREGGREGEEEERVLWLGVIHRWCWGGIWDSPELVSTSSRVHSATLQSGKVCLQCPTISCY